MQAQKALAALRRYQWVLGVAIVFLTLGLFVRFFIGHPQYVTSLRHVSLWAVVMIIGLNTLLTLTLVVIYQATLALCGYKISFKEQLLLTIYSSIANFFGPLQSGPGVRAVYLKSKYGVRLRDYTVAALVYYACFAVISAVFLFGGNRPWWQSLIVGLAVGSLSYLVIWWFMRRRRKSGTATTFQLRLRPLGVLVLATFVQVVIVASYYLVELRAIGIHASLHQVVSYTGAANFALFVSLTPDAIGVRESCLVLSRRLHRLSTAAIVTANVLDRAVYALYLVLLLLVVLAVHAKDRLGLRTTD